MVMNDLHKYECSIQLVQYGKNDYEYEGHINLIPTIVGSGKTYKEALEEIYSNLEAYIDDCDKRHVDYPKPIENDPIFSLSGRVTLRLPKNLHYSLNEYAKKDGMSLNSIIIDALREYITRKECEDNIKDIISPFLKQFKLGKNSR